MSVFDKEFKEKSKTKKKPKSRLPKIYKERKGSGFLYGKKLEEIRNGKGKI